MRTSAGSVASTFSDPVGALVRSELWTGKTPGEVATTLRAAAWHLDAIQDYPRLLAETYRQARHLDGHTQVVYVVRDSKGHVLYIGRTQDLKARMVQHIQSESKWVSDAHTINVERVNTLQESKDLERSLIKELQPLYNKQGK